MNLTQEISSVIAERLNEAYVFGGMGEHLNSKLKKEQKLLNSRNRFECL